MANRETGEYGSDGEAIQPGDPPPFVAAQRRQRRITDLEGPLHRRQIGDESEGELDALHGTTGPWGQRGDFGALIDSVEMHNDDGVQTVLGRLLTWLATETGCDVAELRPRLTAQGATHMPAYRLEVRWLAADEADEGPGELFVPPAVPQAVREGAILPGSGRSFAEEEVAAAPPTAPGLAPGEAAGSRSRGRDTHPDLPQVTAGGVQTGPPAMVAELAAEVDEPLSLDEQPAELMLEIPLADSAMDAAVLDIAHAGVRDALVALGERARTVAASPDGGQPRALLTVGAIPITRVDYDFDDQSFELWVAGFGEQIWAKEHPVSVGLLATPAPVVNLPVRARPSSAPSVILNDGLQEVVDSARRDRATARELPAVGPDHPWARRPDTEVSRAPLPTSGRPAPPRPPSQAWIWWTLAAVLGVGICIIAGFLAWRVVSGEADARDVRTASAARASDRASAAASAAVVDRDPDDGTVAQRQNGERAGGESVRTGLRRSRQSESESAPDPISPPAPTLAPPTLPTAPDLIAEADGATHEVYGTAADEEAPWLALRARRSRRSRLVAKMPDHTRVKLLARSRGWMKVKVVVGELAGSKGWAHGKWLRAVR